MLLDLYPCLYTTLYRQANMGLQEILLTPRSLTLLRSKTAAAQGHCTPTASQRTEQGLRHHMPMLEEMQSDCKLCCCRLCSRPIASNANCERACFTLDCPVAWVLPCLGVTVT